MARHKHPTRRVNPRPSIIPKALEPGKVRCSGCSAVVTLTPNGKVRKHRAPSGEDCAVRAFYGRVRLDEIPLVVFPKARTSAPRKRSAPKSRVERERVLTGYCQEPGCGKFIGPDRMFCGQHLARRL